MRIMFLIFLKYFKKSWLICYAEKKHVHKKSNTKIVVLCLDNLSFINLYAIKMYCLLNLIKNGNWITELQDIPTGFVLTHGSVIINKSNKCSIFLSVDHD